MTFMGGSFIDFDRFKDGPDVRAKATMNALTGGPNSGFEVDDIEFFKQPELTNEFPEMKDEIELIVSTESYVRRLVDFDRRIKEAKGMTRGMAYELAELVPSLEGFNPRHFTEEITSVGAQPSLEAISGKIWALIAAATAVIIAAIWKFISWMFGSSEGGASGASDLDSAKEGLKENQKKLVIQDDVLKKTVKIVDKANREDIELEIPEYVDKKKIENSTMPTPLKEEVLRHTRDIGSRIGNASEERTHHVKVKLKDALANIEEGNEIYDYLMNPNQYARIIYGDYNKVLDLVVKSFDVFENVADTVGSQVQLLEDIIKNLEKEASFTNPHEHLEFANGLNLLNFDPSEGHLKMAGYDFRTTAEWSYTLRSEIMDSRNYRPRFDNLDDLTDGYIRGRAQLEQIKIDRLAAFFDILKKSVPVLDKMEKIAKHEMNRTTFGANDSDPSRVERSSKIMSVYTHLRRNVQALMEVYSILTKIYVEVARYGHGIQKALKRNAKKIVEFYHHFDAPPPDFLNYLYHELKEEEERYAAAKLTDRFIPDSSMIRIKSTMQVNDGPVVEISNYGEHKSFLQNVLLSRK